MKLQCFVVGFGLYGSIHGPKEYYVTIQVYTFCTCTDNDVRFILYLQFDWWKG
jgi:hypothetical protein